MLVSEPKPTWCVCFCAFSLIYQNTLAIILAKSGHSEGLIWLVPKNVKGLFDHLDLVVGLEFDND